MKRFGLLAVVACLCGCALGGTARADSITYDIYQGGAGGTLLAEYVVQSFIGDGTTINPFTPTVLPAGIGSPGELDAFLSLGETAILYADPAQSAAVNTFLTSAQFPTSPGTFALDTSLSRVIIAGLTVATPDTLVITSSSTTTTPEPASVTLLGVGAVGLLGYGWRKRRRVAA
jgi:hypothetical protein